MSILDINVLMPPEPTIEDALNKDDNLQIMRRARKVAKKLNSYFIKKKWELVESKNSIEIYKTEPKSK